MKICFHTNWEISSKYIGGTERFLISISKELQALGHEPFIVCSSLNDEILIEGIRVLGRIPKNIRKNFESYSYFSSLFIKNEIMKGNYSIDSLKRLAEYTYGQISDIDADIVNFNSFAATAFLEPAFNYVATNHENELEYDHYWGKGFFNFMANTILNRESHLHKYKALITPSKYYAKEFSARFGLNVEGVNLGICLTDFKISSKNEQLRREYLNGKDGLILLLPSRFQLKQKGHDIALRACSILKTNNFPFKIIFTGLKKSCEKYLPEFFEIAEGNGIKENIHITTFSNMQTAYDVCDIVVSPERYCSYGLSVSESLSLGLPTILSDIPTYKEIANGFKHATFFKNESHGDLAEKIMNYNLIKPEINREEAIKFRLKNDIRQCAINYVNLYSEKIYNC